MSDQPGPQAPQNANPLRGLLKAEDVQKAPFLDPPTVAKYVQSFRMLWSQVESNPPGSDNYKNAVQSLSNASNKLRMMAQQHRQKEKLGQQGGNAQQNPAGQSQQQQHSQQGQPSNGQAAGARSQGFSQAVIKHIQEFSFSLPPQLVGTPDAEQKLRELKTTYATHLQQLELTAKNLNEINLKFPPGTEVPQQIMQEKAKLMARRKISNDWAQEFRKTQDLLKRQAEAVKNGQVAASTPQVKTEAATPAAPGTIPGQAVPQIATSQSLQQPVNTPLQIQTEAARAQAHPRSTQSPATAQPQGGPQTQPPTPASAHPAQQNHQQPTQMNGNMAFNQQQMMRQAGTMGQMHQASPQTNNAPRPLTHSAAVQRAQSSYTSEQPANTPNQVQSPSFSHQRERETQNNPKMPIPKQMNMPAPTPVNMPPGRPTMAGSNNGSAPGMMGQAVLSKLPQYMLEGDGERVLSKKKLDELVRQVTGGGDSATGESLTPDVEEAMLQLADDFVDNVITNACRLSKLRDSHQLEIRDLQLVLERQYNIRIPGYASDEIRTVRKLHPAPGWNEKMKALQAAKIMGGKTDV